MCVRVLEDMLYAVLEMTVIGILGVEENGRRSVLADLSDGEPLLQPPKNSLPLRIRTDALAFVFFDAVLRFGDHQL